jgi:hypothetical protein
MQRNVCDKPATNFSPRAVSSPGHIFSISFVIVVINGTHFRS